MFELPSKEEFTNVISMDTGFQEFLSTLSKTEKDDIDQIFSNVINKNIPELEALNNIFSHLPIDHHLRQRSIVEDFTTIPDKALSLYNQCRFKDARNLLERSLFLFRLPEDMPERGLTAILRFVTLRAQALFTEMLGDVEYCLGNIKLAGQHHQQALDLARKCGDKDTEAKALYGLGCHYWQLGDFEQALEHSLQSLEILKLRHDRWHTSIKVMNTLSLIHAELSNIDAAVECCEQALDLAESDNELRSFLPSILSTRSVQLNNMGKFEEARILLLRALSLATENGELRQEALIRHNLGMSHINSAECDNDIEKAMHRFQQAYEISRRIRSTSHEALACGGMAHALVMMDDLTRAEAQYRKAIKLYLSIGSIADAADSLVDLGNLQRYLYGKPKESLDSYLKAVELTEQIRSKMKKERHRIGFADVKTEPYHQIITTYLELNNIEEAFHYLERARSKALLELLSGNFADCSDSKFVKATELNRKINELRNTLDEILRSDETSTNVGSDDNVRRTILRKEIISEIELEEQNYASLCSELIQIAPERQGFVAVESTSISAVSTFITDKSALLELYQTDDQLIIFVVRKNEEVRVVRIELSNDDAQDAVFSYLAALRDLSTRDLRSHTYLRAVRQPASNLYNLIFGQLSLCLDDVTHLIIIPHLFWHYLPFHTLFNNEVKAYLIDLYEISYAPSASVLEICRKKQRSNYSSAVILCRNDGDLPHVDLEGIAVKKSFGTAELFSGNDAAMDKITSDGRCPDVIHCACHGYFDPELPYLSGIAIPPNTSSDRHTLLADIIQMRIESSLVTLSACDTGLNIVSNADELLGLSRGFLGAGAASLLLSLWKVSDRSTSVLMECFYKNHVNDKQTKSRSLQLAMQAVRSCPEYSHPYYWAPFSLIGEWQ